MPVYPAASVNRELAQVESRAGDIVGSQGRDGYGFIRVLFPYLHDNLDSTLSLPSSWGQQ